METVIHSDNDFASVAFLRIKAARLEAKVTTTTSVVYVPPLLDDEFMAVYEVVLQSQQTDLITSQAQIEGSSFRHPKVPLIRCRRVGAWVSISNVQSPSKGSTLKDEVTRCFELLIGEFAAVTMGPSLITFQNASLCIPCGSRIAQSLTYLFHLLTSSMR